MRDALIKNGITFELSYPNKNLKTEYLDRYIHRGDSDKFIELIKANWDNWLDEMYKQGGCYHYMLSRNEYIFGMLKGL